MKLRKGDIVMIRGEIASTPDGDNPSNALITFNRACQASFVPFSAIVKVERQHFEIGDRVSNAAAVQGYVRAIYNDFILAEKDDGTMFHAHQLGINRVFTEEEQQ